MATGRLLRRSNARKSVRKSVSDDFRRHALSISKQLKQRDLDRVWTLDPRGSMILSAWDALTSLALLYTALITPFEVGFLTASTVVDVWFVINRVLDAIFVIDMALQFCVVYQKVTQSPGASSAASEDSAWITERRKIARHYLFGWFPLDLLSLLPSTFDIIPVVMSSAADSPGELSEKFYGLRTIRALRLIKLVRLIRASRLIQRWQAKIGLSYEQLTLAKVLISLLLAAHWYSCIFALQAMLHDDPATTWLGLQGHCSDKPIAGSPDYANRSAVEVFEIQCADLELTSFYLAALSWSFMVITGLGGTDQYPSQDNAETSLVTVLVVMGALFYARILATFCELATNSDPAMLEYRQALDDLNRFCRDNNFPAELKQRLRVYFQQRKHVMLSRTASGVIHKMSTSLQLEVVMRIHSHWLNAIWFLRGAEEACLVQLALRMEPCVFAPSELPESDHLYVIHRGIVMYGPRLLTSGKMWGEATVLATARGKTDNAPVLARCMTYVEVYSLSCAVFLKMTNAFDNARNLVRRGAVITIARRAIVKLVRQLRRQRDGGDQRDFIEMLMEAASTADGMKAKVIGHGGDTWAAYEMLQDEVVAVKTSVDTLKEEMRAEMGTVKAALNRLLEKAGASETTGV